MSRPLPAQGPVVFSVSEITRDIRRTLGDSFDDVWVRGEITGFKRHQPSGHLYFSLKDEGAVLACAMWKMVAGALRFAPADGMEVEARGSIDVYARRGSYQLIVRELTPGGRGALLLALEELRRRLGAEGLFDPARKRSLPRYPRRIGLVTSPSGAAVRDLLHGLARRWPLAEVVLLPVPVQGKGAAEAVAAGIRRMNDWGWPEVLIVGRGGGSLEDLWAFNEEPLVRAIAASRIPVVSAVGHEVDRTLCDEAADLRAPTPSAAAELATPDRHETGRHVARLRGRATAAVERTLAIGAGRLAEARASYGFRRPQDLLGSWGQELDRLHARLRRALGMGLDGWRERLRRVRAAYGLRRPQDLFADPGRRLRLAHGRLGAEMARALARRADAWRGARRQLVALSPRGVLARGYALVRLPDGRLVRSWRETPPGTRLALEFAEGGARARVESAAPAGGASAAPTPTAPRCAAHAHESDVPAEGGRDDS